MWIVRLALRRPYTVAIMSVLILVMGALSLSRMVVDIFPTIDIPVVIVLWNYPGLSAEDMERRVVIITERAMSTTVNGIERIESQSTPGIGLLKVYFQPGTDVAAAIAQINAVTGTILRITPPGMTPPNILQFNASNVPVAQLTAYSATLPEERIFDYSLNFIRVKLFTIPGLATPAPYGGKQRQINVDLDLRELAARGLSPSDAVAALQSANVILPAGTSRIGSREYDVFMNSSPPAVADFADLPLRVVGGRLVRLGDVAHISDSFADQTNIVHIDGKRATYLAILKHADASTLAVVQAARGALPAIEAVAPHGLELRIDFDQSVFVRAAIRSVLREAIVSSILVSLMIGLFLGSWRSMVIVSTSIPLAIFCSIIGLHLFGYGVNIMTLGGLALAIGMLVDDATVEVENIHRNRMLGKPLTRAILDGAQQIAVPAIVATLAICIVFFPVVLLVGPAKYLFAPLALAVVLAMLASYLLSRTLVPTLARLLMASEHHGAVPHTAWGRLARSFNDARDRGFERFQNAYGRLLHVALDHRVFTLAVAAVIGAASFALPFVIGTDFFPAVDTGQMKLHFRAPAGTRIEETEKLVLAAEARIREIIPAGELQTINDNIGVPPYYNLGFVGTDNVSGMDAEIRIALRPEHHPTAGYQQAIRRVLEEGFPGCTAYFQSADIVSQVLNFGLAAPVDVQIEGSDLDKDFVLARRLRDRLRLIPGAEDVHIRQLLDYPSFQVDVDRQRAAQVGLAQLDVANALVTSLSSSALVAPSYFLNPQNNVNYTVVVKTPLRDLDSVSALMATPLSSPTQGGLTPAGPSTAPAQLPRAPTETLSNIAEIHPRNSPAQINHYTVQRVLDIDASVEGRDLGSVAADIDREVRALGPLPPGMRIHVRGQDEVMKSSFRSLGLGLILAGLLVYCLMVVLFQTWLDPFIIMVAVPGALVGILWMLALTGTTLNVESLMGAIMSIGIAVSNSILLVNFANDVRTDNAEVTSTAAALEAGKTRLRPVLMTALAMIIGMIPMALALGEGGEQNAPLGRAVIGGLLVATLVTLFIVPVVYSLLRVQPPTKHLLEARFLAEERGLEPLPEGGTA
ncbi:MAG TPA: efflux RND transporter permease subunit [Myxococcales bacterium]|nr:efflux RND transporter permease subunit [Myxococcales bacterium]